MSEGSALFRIIYVLATNKLDRGMTMKELGEATRISQPTLRKHLPKLEAGGIIASQQATPAVKLFELKNQEAGEAARRLFELLGYE